MSEASLNNFSVCVFLMRWEFEPDKKLLGSLPNFYCTPYGNDAGGKSKSEASLNNFSVSSSRAAGSSGRHCGRFKRLSRSSYSSLIYSLGVWGWVFGVVWAICSSSPPSSLTGCSGAAVSRENAVKAKKLSLNPPFLWRDS